MQKIHIIGSGGLAKEIISYIEGEQKKRFEIVGCWGPQGFNNLDFARYFRGDLDEFKEEYSSEDSVIIAIANNMARKEIVENDFKELDINYESYIHPTCEISKYAKIGKGCILAPGCIICGDAAIEDFNFFNTHCIVGHDTLVGSYNCFFPKVEICGSVTIFNKCTFGINSIVLPGVEVHSNTRLDAMSVLRKSTKSDGLYFGNPARLIK